MDCFEPSPPEVSDNEGTDYHDAGTDYTVIGCYKRDPDDVNATTCSGDQTDYGCMHWTKKDTVCRSGFPLYRNCHATTPDSCSKFCMDKGLDVFGLVEGHECRCGASKLNEQIWHQDEPKEFLLFDANKLHKLEAASAGTCFQQARSILVARFSGHFHAGGLPDKQTNLVDIAYIDSVVAGRLIKPMDEEHSADEGAGMAGTPKDVAPQNDPNHHEPLHEDFVDDTEPVWHRPCWPGHCGPGAGPWNDRTSDVPDGVTDQFQEYVIIKYAWNDGSANSAVAAIDDARKEAFREAVTWWHNYTCIVLEETDTPVGPHIEVGVYVLNSCYVQSVGYAFTLLNLGWCNSASYIGNMAHEIGHALGMKHEMTRDDAQAEYHGKGPFLTVHWENIPEASSKAQYLPVSDPFEKTYMGSADDGPGDPQVGYAEYDFGSIMHYPASSAFTTIPEGESTGQRTHLSSGDITQILDTYQCRSKGAPSLEYAATPTTLRVSNLCTYLDFLNGDYTQVGNTASGAPYYQHNTWYYIYWDPDCDASGDTGVISAWILDVYAPSETDESDLDRYKQLEENPVPARSCSYYGRAANTFTGYPPLGWQRWMMYCGSTDGWVARWVHIVATDTTSTTASTSTQTPSYTATTGTTVTATITTVSATTTVTETTTTVTITTVTVTATATTATATATTASTTTTVTATTVTVTATATTATATSTVTETITATTTTTVTATTVTVTTTATTATATSTVTETATTVTSTSTATTATITSTVTETATTVTATATTVSVTTSTTSTTSASTTSSSTSTSTISTSTTSSTTTTKTTTTTSTTSTSTTTTASTSSTTTSTTSTTTTSSTTTSATTSTTTTTTTTTTTSTTTTTVTSTTSSSTTSSSTTSSTTSSSVTTTSTTSTSTTTTTTSTTSTSATSVTTTRTGGDPADAVSVIEEAREEESSLLTEMVSGGESSLFSTNENFTVIAVRLDSSNNAGLTVEVDGTEMEVSVPASTLPYLGVDSSVLVVTSFATEASSSMGDSSVSVTASARATLYSADGEPINVKDLPDPIRITLSKGSAGSADNVICSYWDEFGTLWATDGVELSTDDAAEGAVVCLTRHFTHFAAITRNNACPHLKLLSAEGLSGLRGGGWLVSIAALCFWGLWLALALLLVVAALVDSRRHVRAAFWADEDFMVALKSAPDDTGKRSCLSCVGSLLCMCVCNCVVLDVIIEIGRSWCDQLVALCNFLGGLLEGLRLCCVCRCSVLLHGLTSWLLDSSARWQAAASLGISRATSQFTLSAAEVTALLLSHARKKARDQEKKALVEGDNAEQNPNLAFVEDGKVDDLPACNERPVSRGKSQLREMHDSVAAELERHLMNSARWFALPCSIFRLFFWRNPIASCLVQCTFLASSLRVVLLMVDVVGALMLCSVFFQVTESLSRRVPLSSTHCEPQEDTVEPLALLIVVGFVAFIISVLPGIVLRSLSTRRIKTVDYRGCWAWNRMLRTWNAQDALIWLLALAYLGFSTLFILLFLANVSKADQDAWILSGAVAIVLKTLVIPFCVSFLLPFSATLSLSISACVTGVWKRDLLKERYVKTQRELPMVFV